MEIRFTYHAILRIEEREVALADVYDCIGSPLKVRAKNDQFLYMKFIENKGYLPILPCHIENDMCTIITVYISTDLNRYL